MFNLKSSFSALSAVVIAVVGFGQVAIAQPLPEDDYVQVGEDQEGTPIMLDKTSINGGNFELGQIYGSGLKETSMRVSCSENRVFLKRIAVYTSSGRLSSETKKVEELTQVQPGSPVAVAMKMVCQGMGAKGW